jgi:hypothetical protein
MRYPKVLPLLLSALFLFCGLTIAQTSSTEASTVVPRLVNFSGKAVDAQGKTISGVTGVTLSIYKDQYEGSPLWTETQNVTADGKGNYTVQLGATTSSGLPLDLFSTGEARWLGVRFNGGEEQPRVLLLSVPYALKAADAETIGGLPPSAFVLAAPPTAAANSTGSNDATGTVPPPASSDVTTTGGTANAVPLFSTATNIQNSAISQTGSGTTAKIGINTTTPASTLDVKGGGTVRGTLSLPATSAATATQGYDSQPIKQTASVFNSGTGTPVTQNFQWQAEPANNDTSDASGTLNLLFGSGGNKPAETGLNIASSGQIKFAAGQTFPGTGTITGITTASGGGLSGGGNSGNLSLSLVNTCATNQTLHWNGSAWACTTPSTGTVTSLGLSAPSSDFTVSGSPVTSSGTLGLNWTVAPTPADTANAIVKRDGSGNIQVTSASATASSGYPISGTDNSTSGLYAGVSGVSAYGSGVFGKNTSNGYGVSAVGGTVGVWASGGDGVDAYASASNGSGVYGNGGTGSESSGVTGIGNTGVTAEGYTNGVNATGNSSGVLGYGSGTQGSGVYGNATGSSAYGVYGIATGSGGVGVGGEAGSSGTYGVYGFGPTAGVYGNGGSYGVYGVGATYGVLGESADSSGSGGGFSNSTTGDALFTYNQSGGYAAFFDGNVDVDGKLSKAGGSFKIDHPLDPENKYLYHSFVESPDMKNIYDGNVTTDAAGNAVVTLPEWFETLNRDFRYQLTVIGQFAQAIVAKKVENNQFQIRTSLPNVEVSWQVTGIRQDPWANANRIPVEEEKEAKLKGFYLHPELYGAPAEKSIAWARHPEMMKKLLQDQEQMKQKQAGLSGSPTIARPALPLPIMGKPAPPIPPAASPHLVTK